MSDKPFSRNWVSIEPDNIFIAGFEVKPPEGFVNKEGFPECCENHSTLMKNANEWFEKFPNCCKRHEVLPTKSWFRKEHFNHVPLKLVEQITYTQYFIRENINHENWFKLITDYLEYNEWSFGQPNIGFDRYIPTIKEFLSLHNDVIPDEKRIRLFDVIENYYYKEQETRTPSFDELFNVYDRWLEVFPFDIGYFRELKVKFQNQIPFLSGKIEVNQFSGLAKAKMVTIPQLVERLNKTTVALLDSVKSTELVEHGIIPDINQHAVELLNENHRVKQRTLLSKPTPEESEYVSLVTAWLENEKDYFRDLVGLSNYKPAKELNASGELRAYFKDAAAYEKVISLLSEKGYCNAETTKWTDAGKGNKSLVTAILKQLHVLNYYKSETPPTAEQLQLIAKVTFGVEVGIVTARKTKATAFNLSFIPAANLT